MEDNLQVIFMQNSDNKKHEDMPQIIFISLKDKQKLVDAFAWLIREDKKLNPDFYKYDKN